jgi:ABC-type sugar transport system permease subunit
MAGSLSLPFRSAASRGQRQHSALARKEALWFYVLISPWLAGFVLFTGGPTLASALLSFTHNDPVNWPPKWVGLTNYEVMFRDRLFWKSPPSSAASPWR